MKNNTEMNKEMATLFGILAGDGCLSFVKHKYFFISVTGNFYDDEPFFNQIVVPLLEKIRKKKTTYRARQKHGKIEINFVDKELFSVISNLGFPVGKKGTKLSMPKNIDYNLIKHLIAGYFATDGCLVLTNNNGTIYPRIEIQSLSSKIMNQIKEFLIKNGMFGNVYTMKRKKTMYRLQFNGVKNLLLFEKTIGFINPKHKNKFESYWASRSSSAG